MSSLHHSLLTLALLFCVSSAHAFGGLFQRKAGPPESLEDIVLAQIVLDEGLMGPGKIDGKLGEFTVIAARHYNEQRNLAADNWFRILKDAQKNVKQPFTSYVVRDRDHQFVGAVPADPADQEKLEYLSYRSLLELVAERYHTDERFLRKINPGRNLDRLRVGESVTVPNVTPFEISAIRKHQRFGENQTLSSRYVIVDTQIKVALIYEKKGGKLVASFPITPGVKKFVPYGEWTMTTMVTTPEFRWDKRMLEEGERGDEFFQLPPGPNSPVGVIWAGLSKSGIGLHGTSSPETIGRSRSAGCIRLANWDAIRLSSVVRPGAVVIVK
tara:strand:- start:63565 stop:64545 length:981 start_codon:yes stop_codon:yes gene_type:complete